MSVNTIMKKIKPIFLLLLLACISSGCPDREDDKYQFHWTSKNQEIVYLGKEENKSIRLFKYDNGVIQLAYRLSGNPLNCDSECILNGAWTYFDPNGSELLKTSFVDGKLDVGAYSLSSDASLQDVIIPSLMPKGDKIDIYFTTGCIALSTFALRLERSATDFSVFEIPHAEREDHFILNGKRQLHFFRHDGEIPKTILSEGSMKLLDITFLLAQITGGTSSSPTITHIIRYSGEEVIQEIKHKNSFWPFIDEIDLYWTVHQIKGDRLAKYVINNK